MNKLFDTLSLENIHTQVDDPIVKTIEEAFTKLKSFIEYDNVGSTITLFRRKSSKKIIDDLDKALSKRFGLNLKHLATSQTLYATMTVSPGVNTVLDKDRSETMESLKSFLRECDRDGECRSDKNPSDIINFDTDFGTVIRNSINSVNSLSKSISTKGVTIDFENAKIDGLNSNITFFLLADFFTLLSKHSLDLTPLEVTAILLHEIGHDFTHIAYSYRKIRSTTGLLESLTDLADGKDTLKKIKLISKEKLGKDIKSNDVIEAHVELFKNYIGNSGVDNMTSFTDSEFLADQFASRFGLGAELARSLNNVNKMMMVDPLAIAIIFAILAFVYTLILSMIVTLALTIGAIVGVATIFFMVILPRIMDLLLGGSDTKETTYDSSLDRLSRIRLDTIRQIKNMDLPKKITKLYLKSIDEMSDIVNENINNKSIFAAIGDLSPWNVDRYTMTRTQKLIEEMNENNLHVNKNKLSILYDDL